MHKADGVEGPDGRLAAGLAATLEPQLQDALDHPVRREVVRVLESSRRALCLAELADEIPAGTPKKLSYHLQVLRGSGLISADRSPSRPQTGPVEYTCAAVDDAVTAVLEATREWDQDGDGTVPRDRTSHLTMFRLPRPGNTVRLRGLLRTRADR
jgi:DNA-binding HxlR family transcriptional regulator